MWVQVGAWGKQGLPPLEASLGYQFRLLLAQDQDIVVLSMPASMQRAWEVWKSTSLALETTQDSLYLSAFCQLPLETQLLPTDRASWSGYPPTRANGSGEFSPRLIGPFPVEKGINGWPHPNPWKMHPAFHGSQLKSVSTSMSPSHDLIMATIFFQYMLC